jgi:hypothetical protein
MNMHNMYYKYMCTNGKWENVEEKRIALNFNESVDFPDACNNLQFP